MDSAWCKNLFKISEKALFASFTVFFSLSNAPTFPSMWRLKAKKTLQNPLKITNSKDSKQVLKRKSEIDFVTFLDDYAERGKIERNEFLRKGIFYPS